MADRVVTFTCAGCGETFTQPQGGGRAPERCAECKRERRRLAAARRYAHDPQRARDVSQRYRKRHPDRVKACRRRYYEAHSEEERRAMRDAYMADPERYRRLRREQYADDPERQREYARAWRKQNPDRVAAQQAARRARIAGAYVESVDRLAIFERDGGRCHICRHRVSATSFHLDHLVPLSKGGAHTASNLAIAHPRCNISRGAGRIPAQLLLIGGLNG